MLKKLGKYFGWAVGSLLALGLVAYAVLVVINLKDEPPAPEIAVLQSLQDQDTPITSEANSYFFVLGFSGPPDFEIEGDPLIDDYNFRSLRNEAVTELSETCSESEVECLRLLETSQETVVQWLADEGWLLDRYRALTAMTEFREALPFEATAPLPSYHVVSEAQRLIIADARLAAEAGDAAKVRDALEQDLTYWRMVLRSADTLITKMIATAAIVRHFKLGNLVLRRLPDASKAAGVPPSWRVEISMAERSMRRCLAGEWSFFDSSIRRMADDNEHEFNGWSGVSDSTTRDRIAWVALKPFWQHQDTSNRYARLMFDLGNAFDVPYEDIPHTIATVDKLQHFAYEHSPRLYNLAGDVASPAAYGVSPIMRSACPTLRAFVVRRYSSRSSAPTA